jgi:hypothetical protein
MKRLDIDFGNGATKYLRNGQPVTVPAMIADVIDPAKFASSTVIEVMQSESGMMQNGAMFITHEDAKFQAPTKAIRVGDVPRSQGKARYGLHQVMAIVESSGTYEIVCSVPDPSIHGKALEAALLGRHVFKKNRQEFAINIDEVTVRPEGYGAAYLALSAGQAPSGKMTATLDIGYQTAIVSVFDPRGTEINDLRIVMPDGGCMSLYQSIAQHTDVRSRFGGGITTTQIEMAVRDTVASPFGVQLDGQSIDALYRRAKSAWVQSIINQAKTSIGEILPQLGAIVVFGGGAHLCPELATMPKVIMLDDPQTANVRGLGKIQIARPIAAYPSR